MKLESFSDVRIDAASHDLILVKINVFLITWKQRADSVIEWNLSSYQSVSLIQNEQTKLLKCSGVNNTSPSLTVDIKRLCLYLLDSVWPKAENSAWMKFRKKKLPLWQCWQITTWDLQHPYFKVFVHSVFIRACLLWISFLLLETLRLDRTINVPKSQN